MRILLIFISIALLQHGAHAQDHNTSSGLAIKAGYFGEFVMHPGLYAGVDYTLKSRSWMDLHWDSEIGGYVHKWNNNALFLQTTLGVRFKTSWSGFADLSAGIGYMASSPNGDVYSSEDNGRIREGGRPWTSHAKPTVQLMLGWDRRGYQKLPLTIGLGIDGYWQTHFNHIALPHAALRLGVTYPLKMKNNEN